MKQLTFSINNNIVTQVMLDINVVAYSLLSVMVRRILENRIDNKIIRLIFVN